MKSEPKVNRPEPVPNYLQNGINPDSRDQAVMWLTMMVENELIFHPDDRAEDIIFTCNSPFGGKIISKFDPKTCELIDHNMDTCINILGNDIYQLVLNICEYKEKKDINQDLIDQVING